MMNLNKTIKELLERRVDEVNVLLDYFKYENLQELSGILGGFVVSDNPNSMRLEYKEFVFTISESNLGDNYGYFIDSKAFYYPNLNGRDLGESVEFNVHDVLNNEESDKEILLERLSDLDSSMYRMLLSMELCDIDVNFPDHIDKYPFRRSFDEVYASVSDWSKSLKSIVEEE